MRSYWIEHGMAPPLADEYLPSSVRHSPSDSTRTLSTLSGVLFNISPKNLRGGTKKQVNDGIGRLDQNIPVDDELPPVENVFAHRTEPVQ
jgi:hypothetical protein